MQTPNSSIWEKCRAILCLKQGKCNFTYISRKVGHSDLGPSVVGGIPVHDNMRGERAATFYYTTDPRTADSRLALNLRESALKTLHLLHLPLYKHLAQPCILVKVLSTMPLFF